MPTLVFASTKPRVWVGRVTGTYNPDVDGPLIKAAQIRGKFERIGAVDCASGWFLVFVLQKPTQQCDATKLVESTFKNSDLRFDKLEALDMFHASLFGWTAPALLAS